MWSDLYVVVLFVRDLFRLWDFVFLWFGHFYFIIFFFQKKKFKILMKIFSIVSCFGIVRLLYAHPLTSARAILRLPLRWSPTLLCCLSLSGGSRTMIIVSLLPSASIQISGLMVAKSFFSCTFSLFLSYCAKGHVLDLSPDLIKSFSRKQSSSWCWLLTTVVVGWSIY